MYRNVGQKIKTVASIFCWLGITCSILIGLWSVWKIIEYTNIIKYELIVPIVLYVLAGCLVSWLSSLVLYGFGQLVDNSDIQTKIMIRKEKAAQHTRQTTNYNNGYDHSQSSYNRYE